MDVASSSSSPSPSSPSSSSLMPTSIKYDVFLSFRGEDTREKFTSHLHAKLIQKHIKTYIDRRISKGGNISEELIEAIKASRISVIIFSENYASSSWCLNEVMCILKCKKEHGQIVVPVFYDVQPTHVRKQLKSFKVAFKKHKKEKADKVDAWRDALKEVASTAGWDSQKYKGTEAEFVEAIAKDILVKLNVHYSSSDEFKDLIGINKSIGEMEHLLCMNDSLNVRVIGIWGMGGLGKTTLARVMFRRLSSKFLGCCFLENIREETGKHDGLKSLRKKLFSELLSENDLKTITSSHQERLRHQMVLVVLDDVDEVEQLEVLAAKHDWFGPGSRIIITTRDAQVLRDRADEKYELTVLDFDDALQLFNLNAFKRNSPTMDNVTVSKRVVNHDHVKPTALNNTLQLFSLNGFERNSPVGDVVMLSKRVVNYAKGNPLALKVLGSFLRCRRKENWEIELKKLEEVPNKRIHNILKISFDALDVLEQDIFLDIVCLFELESMTCRKFVEHILGIHRSYVNIGIDSLIDKSLITIKDNNIMVHDLLREMGREIERQQCKRTRLWHEEHLYHVFKNIAGTSSAVEEISCFIGFERKWSPTMFQGMHSLWFLHIPDCFSGFPQDFLYLPDSLKCLIINHCPWRSLPSVFMAHNLVELRMPRSNLVQLWSGVQDLGSLKCVDLSHSNYLIEVSALSRAPNLVNVDLSFCRTLRRVPPLRFRIGDKLDCLELSHTNCCHDGHQTSGHLKLNSCISVKLVEKISGNLKELNLSNLASLEELSSSVCSLYYLDYLNLRKCLRLKSLPSDLQKLKSLKRLDLNGCYSLDKLPVLPRNLIELDLTETSIEQVTSSSIEHLSSLQKLTLDRCRRLKSLPVGICKLESLKILDLNRCHSFNKLPVLPRNLIELDLTGTFLEHVHSSSIEHLSSLEKLALSGCRRLKILPTGICKLKSLKRLDLTHSYKLEILPVIVEAVEHLETLDFQATGVQVLSFANLHFLTSLDLSSYDLSEIPNDICSLSSIKKLCLGSTSVEELPSSICYLYDLEYLNLGKCLHLKGLPCDIQKLRSLKNLILNGCYSFEKLPVLPRNLIELDLTGTSIELLPSSSIKHLSSLEKLMLYGCKRLKSLPTGICKLRSLKRLDLTYCYKLDIFPTILDPMEHLETLNFRESGIRVLPSLGNLHFLTSLDLCSSNLSEIPDDIDRLSSIERLILDGSCIEGIPVSIKKISKLNELSISNCLQLKSLPELPLSLRLLDASGCILLETISNSRDALVQESKSGNHVITSTEFLYADCLKLDENTRNNIVKEFQLRTFDMSSIKSVLPHGRLRVSDYPSVSICCPGNKVPIWFTYQLEHSSININRLPSNWMSNNFLGFALCAVVAEDILDLDLCCEANFKTDYGESYDFFWNFSDFSTLVFEFNSSNIFMWYKHEDYRNCIDAVAVSFRFYNESGETKVTTCGVRPLYLQDAEELGITNKLGKSNATGTVAITPTLEEPRLKRRKTVTFSSQ